MGEEIKKLKKYHSFAIFGGTLDPIHNGHIQSAKNIKRLTGVDKILLLPLGDPPHKDSKNVTEGKKRLEMAYLAIKNDDDFVLSSMEIDRKGKTYTIDTIRELRKILGNEIEFYFILGADALQDIYTWKSYEELLKICSFIAVSRPGYNTESLKKEIEFLDKKYGGHIIHVETPEFDVSSSEIRQKVKNGEAITGLVCPEVEKYIYENKLYK